MALSRFCPSVYNPSETGKFDDTKAIIRNRKSKKDTRHRVHWSEISASLLMDVMAFAYKRKHLAAW